MRTRRVIRVIVLIALVAFIALVALTIDWRAASSLILHASPTLIGAVIIAGIMSAALKGVRWALFLRDAGFPSLRQAIAATLLGAAMNAVVVANAGDVSRVVFIARRGSLPTHSVVAALALDKLCDVVTFALMVVAWSVSFPLPNVGESSGRARYIAVAILAIVVSATFARAAARGDSPWVRRIRSWIGSFANSLRTLATTRNLSAGLALSVLSWIAQIATFAFAAKATGIDVPLAASIAGLIAVSLIVPLRTTPGNVGVFQLFYALAVERFGVPRADAVAIAILIQALQIAPITLVGAVIAPFFIGRKADSRPI
jgi:glycosyltransferase 2 family protein